MNVYALGLPAAFNPLASTLILLAGGILAFGLAIYLFDWDSRNTRRGRSPYLAILALVPYIIGALLLG